jgi:CO/xanthine dehydrogenase Mo-binding subunit
MTGFLDEREFSRKSFIKGSGAMIVGLSVAGAGLSAKAAKAAAGDRLNPADPYATLVRDFSQVDTYVVMHPDNTCSITCGGMDNGTGTGTGWLLLAAEELNMDLKQMHFVLPDTGVTAHPQQGTSSSFGTKGIGPQVRTAAAYAKQTMLNLASTQLGVPLASLTVKSGVISGGGKSITYGQLMGDKLFNTKVPVEGIYSGSGIGLPGPDGTPIDAGPNMFGPYLKQGVPPTKAIDQYSLVGTRVPRIDIPDIVTGVRTYVANIRVPGMLHGRMVLPRGQGAYTSGAKPVSVDESSIKHLKNVQVVRKGDFVGVVAAQEYNAIQAAAQLKVTWAEVPTISSSGNLWKQMRDHDEAGQAKADPGSIGAQYGAKYGPVGNVDAALKSAATVVSASYGYHYQSHAPIGPQVAVADVTPNGARIFTYAQGVSGVPAQVASAIGLPANRVRATEFWGSSHMGGGGGVNPSVAAAVMSQAVGKPVRVQNMRWDQQGWDSYGAVFLQDMRGGIDANGNIVAIDRAELSPSGASTVITQQQLATPYPANPGRMAIETSANGVQYEIPNWRVLWKTLPLYNNYFPTTFMRASQSAQTTFATEVFADELAYAAKMDPVAFRRQNVRKTQLIGSVQAGATQVPWSFQERFLGVLNAVAQASNWQPRVAGSQLSDETIVRGRGVSWGPRAWPATFGAAVVEIEVNKKTGKILVEHIYAAQDSGLVVNPAGVENQIIGQVVMNTGRALVEEVRFDKHRVTSLDWVTYPILRFKDMPRKVTPIVITHPEIQMSGAGDHVMEHIPAAIANAFFDATGVRIREVPMTPARVRAALKAKGQGVLGVD